MQPAADRAICLEPGCPAWSVKGGPFCGAHGCRVCGYPDPDGVDGECVDCREDRAEAARRLPTGPAIRRHPPPGAPAGLAEMRDRFALPMLEGPHPQAGEKTTCSVCGRVWRPWARSRLPCHGSCLISTDDQDVLLKMLDAPKSPSVRVVADALGVTAQVLQANLGAAAKRAGRNMYRFNK